MFDSKIKFVIMFIRKRSGPNTDPRRTPKTIVDTFKLEPLIITNCLRLVKHISNHLFDIPLSP